MTKKLTLKDLAQTAHQRGGYCLATTYENTTVKVEWECSEGHVFQATTSDVRSGRWCPRCSQSFFFKEEICRLSFETIFNQTFPKTRPTWLLNSRGNRMELDGYCEKLELAFEYNGEQHYQENFFSQNHSLENRKNDDELKKQLCQQKGVLLVIFTPDDDLTKIPDKIRKSAKHRQEVLEEANFEAKIDFDAVWQHRNKIATLREFARTKNGNLISKKYVGQKTHLIWECEEGHQWTAAPGNVLSGHWCPYCAGLRIDIDEIQNLAKKFGGKCLSTEYVNVKTKMKWRCKKGHEWETSFDSVRQGNWCRKCSQTERRKRERDFSQSNN